MKHLAIACLSLFLMGGSGADGADHPTSKTPWGGISSEGDGHELTIRQWPADRLLPIEPPFPNIVSAWILEGGRRSIHWMFNPDATRIALGLPPLEHGKKPPIVYLLTAEKTNEQPDGTIVLSALDANVVGEKAKLETHPGNHRIGYWSNPKDYVEWSFEAEGTGRFEVEIAYSRSGRPGARLMLEIDDRRLPVTLASTGNWYVYTGQIAGRIEIARAGRHTARVKCVDPAGGAVMNLKAVLLRYLP